MNAEQSGPEINLVREAYAFWSSGAIDDFMRFIDPDIAYALRADPAVVPFGGERRGGDAFRAHLVGLRELFVYLYYVPNHFKVEGDVVRFRVDFTLRHKPSGQLLSGNIGQAVTVRDGRIVIIEEFPDARLLEAFCAMTAGDRNPCPGSHPLAGAGSH